MRERKRNFIQLTNKRSMKGESAFSGKLQFYLPVLSHREKKY